MKRILPGFSILIFLILGCEKEKIVYRDREYSWNRDLYFSGKNAVIVNSQALDNELIVLSLDNWTTIDSSNEHEGYFIPSNSNITVDQKPAISKTLFVNFPIWRNDPIIRIATVDRFHEDRFVGIYSLSEYDSSAHGFFNIDYLGGKTESPVISKSSYVLVPYRAPNSTSYTPFLIIKPEVRERGAHNIVNPDISTSIVRKLIIPDLDPSLITQIHSLETQNDYFFVGINSHFYRIDTLGNHEEVISQRITGTIIKPDSLIAISDNGQTYLSTNSGENWNTFHQLPDGFSYNYVIIGNKIIGYPRWDFISEDTGLIHVSIDETSFKINDIPSDGLEYRDITSISAFNNRVYVTTLSGLFYKDVDDLLGK